MDSTKARSGDAWTMDGGRCDQSSGRSVVYRLWIVLLKQRTEEPRQGGVDGVVAAAVRGQQADVGGFV